MQIQTYTRTPFDVEAVKVTPMNMVEVAEWCGGTIETEEDKNGTETFFIKVNTYQPMNERQTKAYVNDVVLNMGNSFKVYTKTAFDRSFVLKKPTPKPTKPKQKVVNRDARDGEFVSAEFAAANPDVTVTETIGAPSTDADGLGENSEGHLDAIGVEAVDAAPIEVSPGEPDDYTGPVEVSPDDPESHVMSSRDYRG